MISLNDVLLAMSNIPVDDPIAEIWGRGLQGGYRIIEYTGTLPVTITANGDALLDYRIYGDDGGVGEPENLIDADNPGTQRVELEPNVDYCLCKYTGMLQGGSPSCYVYDENNNRLFGDYINLWVSYSFTNPSNGAYAIISFDNRAKGKLSFTKGRADNNSSLYPANYIPYGYYKLPMTIGDGNTTQSVPVYIGENQLDAGEYVSYGEQKIYRDVDGTLTPTDPPVPLPEIPTMDGTTVIDYDGDPKPSQMYIKYKGKG